MGAKASEHHGVSRQTFRPRFTPAAVAEVSTDDSKVEERGKIFAPDSMHCLAPGIITIHHMPIKFTPHFTHFQLAKPPH